MVWPLLRMNEQRIPKKVMNMEITKPERETDINLFIYL
jgi:hypothetical protein